ncbi:Uncharacterised protein [Salmonella enterica subsp. enterica serovar Bovismorbificans]|uniref:Uncharacterized protein n=1 Tax=Salmonella enterica subsp. enterica serovar Bovismorbificans TaxID=58097 RepID=A0A655BNA9_SALET|nr:Uncharacterised protein [Salmonella enterica subsp. enterica serovar Bovismorbificans]CQB65349.1 Uncharacterised protein [Salmonella enterica subsp. enterica serovar Bovismorbificans]
MTILIHLERAVAGIGRRTVRQHDLEKALPFNRHIFTVVGLRQVPLTVQALRGDRTHAGTDLQPGRQRRLLGRLRARLADGLIQQIFKYRALTLKTIGADVCQVIGNHIHIGLLRIQTGFGDP